MSYTQLAPSSPDQPAVVASNHAFEWGLASFLVGVILPVVVPMCALVACVGFIAGGAQGAHLNQFGVRGLLDILLGLPFLLLAVPAFGLWFGIRGLLWANATRSSGAFATAGVALNAVVAVVLLVIAVVVLVIRADVLR